MLRADGIAWERLEVSARLKPQGWEQLPGCRVAAGCSRGTGPARGVPKVCPKGCAQSVPEVCPKGVPKVFSKGVPKGFPRCSKRVSSKGVL